LYRALDIDNIVITAVRLHRRVAERFPEAGLAGVALELRHVAEESRTRLEQIRRPLPVVRALVGLAMLLIGVVVAAGVALTLRQPVDTGNLSDLIQAIDAAVNEVVLLALAIFFLLNLEGRLKRREALRHLHELRSLAHVVDMHQLTKDPDQAVLSHAAATESSPERPLSRFQLSRYFDYCSEMLSVTSKVAALYAQYLNDPVVLDAVNDVESLASALSVKIWQKTMVLNVGAVRADEREAVG
jgi:hypothetical protein